MTKGLIRNIATIQLALIVLITTSGFAVFKHSCHIEHTTEYSLMLPEFDCNHYQHPGHEGDDHACCSLSNTDENNECQSGKCCDTDSFIVKLDITLDIHDFNKKAFIADFEFLPRTSKDVITQAEEICHIIISNDLPPPLSGKSLLIFLNQLDTPYPSV
ncbi:MAG: hypothetical protein ABFS05_02550 [Bacteroidota bacterium]